MGTMLHGERTIALGAEDVLLVGTTMCLSAPACQLMRVRRPEGERPEFQWDLSLSRPQLDALIAALEAVRSEMPT